MTISRGKVLLAIGMISTALCGPGWAQAVAGMGGISGVVRDQSGATVPGAKVVVSNPSMGIYRTMETNAAGVFSAAALVPSAGYRVTAEKEGFARYELKDVEVLVGQDVSLNVVLNLGSVATLV